MARLNQASGMIRTQGVGVAAYAGVVVTATTNSIQATLPNLGGGYYGLELIGIEGQVIRRREMGGSSSPGNISIDNLNPDTDYSWRAYYANASEGGDLPSG